MKKITDFPQFKSFSLLLLSTLFLLTVFAFSRTLKSTPTVSVAADKMNLFYIGIDNPITVAMAGVPADKIKVSCENGETEDLGNGHYNVRIKTVGKKIIKVEADGIAPKEIEYRVKRIPDPMSKIGFLSGGAVSIGYFEHQKKISAQLIGWPIEEKCVVQGFAMTIQGSDPVEVVNEGEYFNATSLSLLEVIKSNDVVYFDNIKCKYPGDPAARKINAMVFKMR